MSAITKVVSSSLVALAISSAIIIPTTPARAQVPVLDFSSLAKLAETVKLDLSQLEQLKSMLNTVNNIQTAIGKVGSGDIGGILNLLGGSFGLGGLGDITKLTSIFKGLTATLGNVQNFANLAKNGNFTSAFNQLEQAFKNTSAGIATTQQGIAQSLYQSAQGATQATVDAKMALRAINLRHAATSGMAVAIQAKEQTEKLSDDIKQLAAAAKASKDLRGDLAVNNAIMLKVLEQLQQLIAQQSSLLHINSSTTIAGDSPYDK